jgi:PPOX class probable F420-dependent enzyme
MVARVEAPADRIRRFLEKEPVVWLATADGAGNPGLVPVWFWWDGETLLVASKPGARKVRNIRANGRVMVALGDVEADFDIGLIEAHADLVDVPARALLSAGLAAKYRDRMAAIGLTDAEFASSYSQVIRIAPQRPLPWHGRTERRTPPVVADGRWGLGRVIDGLLSLGSRLTSRAEPA